MQKALIIFNPVSGKEESGNPLPKLINQMVKDGYRVEVHATQKQGDATETCADRGREMDLLVALGGDGTLSEVCGGLLRIAPDRRPELGYLPTGSTNDFANGIGLSDHTLDEQILIASHGQAQDIDMGLLNDRSFIYVAGFGVFTSVSFRTSQEDKNVFGKFAYFREGMKDLGKMQGKRIRIQYDGGRLEGTYLLGLISNSESVAGLKQLTQKTHYSDGKFEVLLVDDEDGALGTLSTFKDILIGNQKNEHMHRFRASQLLIESEEELSYTLDGEDGGSYHKVAIKVVEKAIKIRLDYRR